MLQVQEHTLDRKTSLMKQDGHLVMNNVITEKEVRTAMHPPMAPNTEQRSYLACVKILMI